MCTVGKEVNMLNHQFSKPLAYVMLLVLLLPTYVNGLVDAPQHKVTVHSEALTAKLVEMHKRRQACQHKTAVCLRYGDASAINKRNAAAFIALLQGLKTPK